MEYQGRQETNESALKALKALKGAQKRGVSRPVFPGLRLSDIVAERNVRNVRWRRRSREYIPYLR